jgi:hypothetical protein
MGLGITVDGVAQSYSNYLNIKHPSNYERFEALRSSDKEAAVAEAIVFAMLQTLRVRPSLNDQVKAGGADFICYCHRGIIFNPKPEDRFIVEATSLNPDAVTDRSHIPNEVPDRIRGGAFGMLTQNICNKAKAKVTQLANYPMPRVLAIVSSHFGATVLLDQLAAQNALVSDTHFRHTIGSDTADPNTYTNLEKSVFIKPGPDDTIIACRQSISAILLISVFGDKSEVYGILHPEPQYVLDLTFLPGIPFIRISQWPIVGGKIFTEWTIGHPDGCRIPHFAIDSQL